MWGTRLVFWVGMGAVIAATVVGGAGRAPAATADDPAASGEAAPAGAARATAAATAADATTFESMLRAATPTGDVGTLLAVWVGKCDGEKRELDRVRCRSMRGYLRKVIPGRSFSTIVEDPAAIAVSDFDAAIKGYHLSIAGCLACSQPVTVGRTKERRLITLKSPAKEAESLRAAVELSRNSVGFDTLPEAKVWLDQSRPDLRTQVVFKPAQTEWTFGAERGYALTLLGFRVFNRCTGEVLISRPASTGTAEVPPLEEGCRKRDSTAAEATPGAAAASNLPPQLDKNQINQAMNTIRPQVFACFEKFKVPGLAQFDFVVTGNGTVSSVRLSGAFFGTPTGACLLEVAKDARFGRFSKDRQQFVYPFFLRQ